MLGLGASGPQVIEGFHGVPYEAPVGKMKEIVEIYRMVWRRDRVQHMGKHFQIPLPQDRGTGLGKPLKIINHPVREDIPIAIASLGPTSVETTAEMADAWLPAFYTAEAASAVWGEALTTGASKRDTKRAPPRHLCRWECRDWRGPGGSSRSFSTGSRTLYRRDGRKIQELL